RPPSWLMTRTQSKFGAALCWRACESLAQERNRTRVFGLMTTAMHTAAKRLRRRQTDAERVLWFRLRDRRLAGLKFKRQVPIDSYIADFVCTDAKIIIELDGGQHALQK